MQSHAFICELVTIGEDCFVGHGVMFINDTFSSGGPSGGRKELWRETLIGNRVSIGSNATILPVRIADDVVITGCSLVSASIREAGSYSSGMPTVPTRAWRRMVAHLRRFGEKE